MQKKRKSTKKTGARKTKSTVKRPESVNKWGKNFHFVKCAGSDRNKARKTAASIDAKQKEYSRRWGVDEKTKTIVVPENGKYGLYQRRI